MPYISRILSPDEKIVGVTSVHWIYLVQGALFFFVMHLIGTAMQWTYQYGISHILSDVVSSQTAFMLLQVDRFFMYPFWLLGISYLVPSIIKYLTTEIGLTTRRLIIKRGWISVQMNEFDVKEVYGATVDTGMLGRIFGYGYITLDCRFINDVSTEALPNADKLVAALNEVRKNVLAEGTGESTDEALHDIDDLQPVTKETRHKENLELDRPAPAPKLDESGQLQTPESDAAPAISRQDINDAIAAAIPQIASKVAEELSHTPLQVTSPDAAPAKKQRVQADHRPGETHDEHDMADELAHNFDTASTRDDDPKPTLQ